MDNNKDCVVKEKSYGLISVLFVYTIWGIQSLYWRIFQGIPILQVLAHRIIWSAVLLIILLICTGKLKNLINAFMIKQRIYPILTCSILIGSNWLLNIYAAYSNQVIEASLGHYITPIITICLGVFILKENINLYEILALIIALIGVGIMTITFGKIPLIAVLLVLTFVTYTFFKKTMDIDSTIGITAETIILSPFALIYLTYMEFVGDGILFKSSFKDISLLISTGMFTAIPLGLFAYGVKLVNLSKIGFIQYYAPTLSLIIGIFIFKESFTTTHFISFSFIWVAVLIILLYPFFVKLKRTFQKKTLED